jgi:hypothetical protein
MSCKLGSAGLALAALSLAGCVTTQSWFRPKEAPPPVGPVLQVQAAWENKVMVTQDIVNNGTPLVGIAGRLYLFGQEAGHPLLGEGSAVIDLYDVTPETTQGAPKLLERWEVDRETLRRLARKDMIGWGYTLFLPWNTHRPEINRVQLQVRYLPDKGLPLYSRANTVALRGDPAITATSQKVVPVAKTSAAPVNPPANAPTTTVAPIPQPTPAPTAAAVTPASALVPANPSAPASAPGPVRVVGER